MKTADRWEALEVRHVRAFTAVVEHGSFAGAARELGYTQSAVSQQIFALERIVGASVLRRHPGGRRPVELTETGRLVLAHARPLLARVKAVQADVAALALGEAGQLAVGTFQSFGARILPTVLARFRSVRPRVEVDIRGAVDVNELHAWVESGELDLCFSVLPSPVGPFELRELLADPYVLVTRAGGPERSLGDLDGRRVLLSCSFERRLVEARLLADGIAPASYARFDDNGMIQALAASGEGVAVVPLLAVDADDPRVSVHPLPELPPRQIVAVWHVERELSARARQFVATAVDVCAAWPEALSPAA
jgi:molybdate transport repressor ModE-like protein